MNTESVITITRQLVVNRLGQRYWLYSSDWRIRSEEPDTVGGYTSSASLKSMLRRRVSGPVKFVEAYLQTV